MLEEVSEVRGRLGVRERPKEIKLIFKKRRLDTCAHCEDAEPPVKLSVSNCALRASKTQNAQASVCSDRSATGWTEPTQREAPKCVRF